MSRLRSAFIFLLALLAGGVVRPALATPADIDRLLAAVNGRIVTEGDLQLAHSLNVVVLFGRAEKLSREKEINRLIDLELMRQDLENFPAMPDDENKIDAKMQDLKRAYAEIGGLPAVLRVLGLQESELLSYVRLQSSILKFVTLRFRPFVTVSPKEIEQYYRQTLTNELQKAGAVVPPLREVSAKIQDILAEEKVNDSIDQWIRDMRSHARIEYYTEEEGTRPVSGVPPP